jgi:hypothetical protein
MFQHSVTIKFLGPTNFKGSRISCRFNTYEQTGQKRKIFSYAPEDDSMIGCLERNLGFKCHAYTIMDSDTVVALFDSIRFPDLLSKFSK